MRLLLTTFDPNHSTKYHFAVLLGAYWPNMGLTSKSMVTTLPYSDCVVNKMSNLAIVM